MKEDDNNWPEPDRVGRQELEIVMGNEHISFTTSKIGSLMDVQTSKDPEGLRIFYYLVQVRTFPSFLCLLFNYELNLFIPVVKFSFFSLSFGFCWGILLEISMMNVIYAYEWWLFGPIFCFMNRGF